VTLLTVTVAIQSRRRHRLRAIESEIGYSLGTAKINALAFADDVILVASTPQDFRRACEARSLAVLNMLVLD